VFIQSEGLFYSRDKGEKINGDDVVADGSYCEVVTPYRSRPVIDHVGVCEPVFIRDS